MAVGGMIGGGIFSTLGVVVAIAGAWAWFSFLAAGLIALAAGYSYVKLACHYGKSGGAFTYLRELGANEAAGSLAWILIVGYVLTNAVYAFTFGQYLGHIVGLGAWFDRLAAVAIMLIFVGLNLRSVGEAGWVEVALVWLKLIVLLALAGWGLYQWNPPGLSQGVPEAGLVAALFGGASVFMAYEGFQLLTYDYDDIREPDRNLPKAVLLAIVLVIIVYMLVALGTTMLIGADQVIEHQEVALAVAGEQAWGTAGILVVTLAAVASTGSAINSTLFATARLSRTVAHAGELPAFFAHENEQGVPVKAVVWLGLGGAFLAAVGSLTSLVEAASLAFLFTFTVVCALAFYVKAGTRWITGFGVASGLAACITLVLRLVETDLLALMMLLLLAAIAVFGRRKFIGPGR